MSAKSRLDPLTHAFNKHKAGLIAPPFYRAISKTHGHLTKRQLAAIDKELGPNIARPGQKALPARYTNGATKTQTPGRSWYRKLISRALGFIGLGAR
jgi:hypothetical protein